MKKQKTINSIIVFLIFIFSVSITTANSHIKQYSDTINKILYKNYKITTLAFGGTGVLFTKVNNQLGVMIGGRGSATFNNRFTVGGGGWGMLKSVEIKNSKADTLEFLKFGYGGVEFGYLLYEGKKLSIGSNLLLAWGAGFVETYPKIKGGKNLFPVLEPSIYSQIFLGKLLKLDIGIKYRLITGSKLINISNRHMSGPSIYILPFWLVLVIVIKSVNLKKTITINNKQRNENDDLYIIGIFSAIYYIYDVHCTI